MAVPVESAGSRLQIGPAKELFEMPNSGLDRGGIGYDVAPDGKRFVMLQFPEHTSSQINVVFNWFEELKRLVPTDS